MAQSRRPRVLASALFVTATLVAPTARGQEVRTTDGRVLVGATTKIATGLRISTIDGSVEVATSDIERVRPRSALIAELKRLDREQGDAPFAQLELARLARRYGLLPQMWRHLDACLANCPEVGFMRRRANAFLSDLEAEVLPLELRDAAIHRKVRELVKRARGKRGARVRAIEQVLAKLDGAEQQLRKEARRAGSPRRRLTAIHAISERLEEGGDRFVFRSAILDSSQEVRAEAARSKVAMTRSAAAVRYLAPGLGARDVKVRVRTAEAFANLGDPSAIPLLVHQGPAIARAGSGSGSTRGYVAVTEQRSYVRDFDVEVAQAAFIADPKVDVIQSGVVLDATVHAVNTVRYRLVNAYRGALRKLAGSDPGKDPVAWPAWYSAVRKSNPETLAAGTTNLGEDDSARSRSGEIRGRTARGRRISRRTPSRSSFGEQRGCPNDANQPPTGNTAIRRLDGSSLGAGRVNSNQSSGGGGSLGSSPSTSGGSSGFGGGLGGGLGR